MKEKGTLARGEGGGVERQFFTCWFKVEDS